MTTPSSRAPKRQAIPKEAKEHTRTDVYAAILERITAQRYEPGDRLTELGLADELNVSRTPVREALRELHASGYVQIEKNRGAVVADYDDDLQELFQLRGLLEGFAAGLAAERMTEQEIDELASVQEEYLGVIMAEGPDYRNRAAQINLEFHRLIHAAARNARLQKFVDMVTSVGLARGTYSRYTRGQLLMSAGQHDQLIEAIRRRDRPLAEMAMRVHIGAAEYRMKPEARAEPK